MTLKDIRGLNLTGATADVLAPYEAAVSNLQCYRGGAVAESTPRSKRRPDSPWRTR